MIINDACKKTSSGLLAESTFPHGGKLNVRLSVFKFICFVFVGGRERLPLWGRSRRFRRGMRSWVDHIESFHQHRHGFGMGPGSFIAPQALAARADL